MIDQVRGLIAQYGDQLALVVNMSGGKDSVRMMGYLKEEFPSQPMYVVQADTGFEHIRPVSAEEWARQRSAAYGLPLYTVKAAWGKRHKENKIWLPNPPELVGTRKTYLQMVERRGMFPGTGTRQCTADLKRGPVMRFINTLHGKHQVVLNCMGIRAAESPNREKLNPWTANAKLSTRGRKVFDWYPIFTESLQDVIHWHWRSATPLHPVYVPEYHCDGTTGGYLRRLSCRVCIFSTDADIRAIYEHDREAFDAVSGLEQSMNFTMKNGKSLIQIVTEPPKDNRQYGSEELEESAQSCLF